MNFPAKSGVCSSKNVWVMSTFCTFILLYFVWTVHTNFHAKVCSSKNEWVREAFKIKKRWNLRKKMATKKQNGRQITKLGITHSFLELQSPDFVWKFVWTVRKIFEKQNARQITKLSITCSFLEIQSPDFAWKFVWIVQTNYKSRKVCKYKSTHNSAIFWAT